MSEKVIDYNKKGFINTFQPDNRADYEKWLEENPYAISADLFYSHDNPDYLRVLLNDVTITFTTIDQDGVKIIYGGLWHKGFTWDNASVPKRLRGIVDNDHPKIRIPAIFHDTWYLSWIFDSGDTPKNKRGCRKANRLFRELITHMGGADIDSSAWLGVALKGWDTYETRSEFDIVMAERYCNATDGDVIYFQ